MSSAQPVNLLAIAPYEAMTKALQSAAEGFPGLRLTACTGDLEEGAAIVKRLGDESFDAILSRGGTAELIRAVTELPVVEIPVSFYDILRAVKLAERYPDGCAIAGFTGVAENAYTLCNLLQLDLPIATVRDRGEVAALLDRFQAQGIRTIICDMVTYRQARARGFNTLLLTSGANSLREALAEAQQRGGTYRRLQDEILLLRAMQSTDSSQCLVLNENREQVLAFGGSLREDVVREMRRRAPEVPESGSTMFYASVGGSLHIVTGSRLSVRGRSYTCFRDQPRRIPMRTARHGIRAYDRVECEHLLADSFFSITGSLGGLEQRLTDFAAAGHSIMVLGEEGTGREQIARALYLRSRLKNRPFIAIDAARLNDKNWDYLLRHDSSPLSDADITVFFHHGEETPVPRQRELIELIGETGLDRRLWLIFSCDEREGEPMSEFSRALSNRLGPLTLDLPTLRSRRDEIPALSSLYLDSLNMTLGKQLAGFENGAMDMLTAYPWPGNYTQFRRVLKELAVMAARPYISASDAAELLARERRLQRRAPAPAPAAPGAEGTLEEITARVVRQALIANGGNQTLTAKRLNISRTTLWRILSRSEG